MPERRLRNRYIAFQLTRPGLGRGFAAALHAAVADWPMEERPQLLFIEGDRGLVRCSQRRKDDVVRILNSIAMSEAGTVARTIGASGTIRRAKMKFLGKR